MAASILMCERNIESGKSLPHSCPNLPVGLLADRRRTPAAVRFVSFEPLLGSVRHADLRNIQWAIVGGESGPRARPMNVEWVYEIRDACRRTGAAFFFKQWGGSNKKMTGRLLEGRTWDEFPLGALQDMGRPFLRQSNRRGVRV
jgi:protein gp37